jgi:plasmid maintenance system antidote protein VapI
MAKTHNNKFSILARTRLVEMGLSIKALAHKLDHPRSTVSTAIHSDRFPNVRRKIARKLNLELKEAA